MAKPTKTKTPVKLAQTKTKQELRKEARKRRQETRERFMQARKASRNYEKALVSVAAQIGTIVRNMAPEGQVESLPVLTAVLDNYSKMLRPWAEAVAKQMLTEVSQRDEKSWNDLGNELGRNLKEQIQGAPLGDAYRQIMEEQVHYITSLPLEASQRVHKLVTEGLTNSSRASEIAEEILKSGDVSRSRAMTIARTETSRAATALTEARAKFIGSTQYIWRTAHDADVRSEHRKLEGKVISWDDPPVAGSSGEKAHAGAIYNCRCWPEPIIPDELL